MKTIHCYKCTKDVNSFLFNCLPQRKFWGTFHFNIGRSSAKRSNLPRELRQFNNRVKLYNFVYFVSICEIFAPLNKDAGHSTTHSLQCQSRNSDDNQVLFNLFFRIKRLYSWNCYKVNNNYFLFCFTEEIKRIENTCVPKNVRGNQFFHAMLRITCNLSYGTVLNSDQSSYWTKHNFSESGPRSNFIKLSGCFTFFYAPDWSLH